jgi:competence protein ComGB
MSYGFKRSLDRMFSWIKPRQVLDLNILIDVLESEIDHQELKDILKIDLTKEDQLRRILTNRQFSRFSRLNLYGDKRKALLVLLTSMRLEKNLKEQITKALFYPVFLFGFSFVMVIFVNGLLLRTFQSLLAFMGPKMDIGIYQGILTVIIVFDSLVVVLFSLGYLMFHYRKKQLYQITTQLKPDNQWTRVLSHQFCLKFLHFYRLGEPIDLIMRQIRWSSDEVLSDRVEQIESLLEEGIVLNQAVVRIDPQLEIYFKMSDEGLPIEKYLENHNRIQELVLKRQINGLSRFILGYAYLKIAVIIVVVYQLMLKPIEMMGNYL